MLLEGKVALVTGGSRGIGRACVLELAREGADVAFTYRSRADAAKEVEEEVRRLGRRVKAYQADVCDFARAAEVVADVLNDFQRLDILVNNAGINRDAVSWKMTEEQWDTVIETNLKGYFNYIRHVAPIFRQQKSGKIVNITSINGLRGKFGQTNYSAAKAGIIGLTKALAKELGRYNVNVNAVAPGLIETDIMRNAPQKVVEMALAEIALGRIGKPEDVASVVVFLCSSKARHITGEVVKVDGGQYI